MIIRAGLTRVSVLLRYRNALYSFAQLLQQNIYRRGKASLARVETAPLGKCYVRAANYAIVTGGYIDG